MNICLFLVLFFATIDLVPADTRIIDSAEGHSTTVIIKGGPSLGGSKVIIYKDRIVIVYINSRGEIAKEILKKRSAIGYCRF